MLFTHISTLQSETQYIPPLSINWHWFKSDSLDTCIVAFWVMTRSLVTGYQHLRRTYCLHLKGRREHILIKSW